MMASKHFGKVNCVKFSHLKSYEIATKPLGRLFRQNDLHNLWIIWFGRKYKNNFLRKFYWNGMNDGKIGMLIWRWAGKTRKTYHAQTCSPYDLDNCALSEALEITTS